VNIHTSVIGGVIIVCFYALSAGLLWWLGGFVKNTRLRLFLALILGISLLALPWSEEVWMAWKFKVACASAGLVGEPAVRAEGFLDGSVQVSATYAKEGLITSLGAIQHFDQLGFRFLEYPIANGKVLHEERVSGGLRATILDRPMAQYAYRVDFSNVAMGRGVLCSEESVAEMNSQRVIATYRHCSREGSALTFNPYPIEFCPTGNKRLRGLLYSRVLIPLRQ